MSWLKVKKIVSKCCLLLFYATTANHVLIRLWHATKSGFYMTICNDSVVGPRRSSKALPRAKLAPKCNGHYLVVFCWSDALKLSESWQNHYIWKVCSANWWVAPKTAVPAAGTGQQKGPSYSLWQCLNTCCTSSASKVGLRSFASPAIFIWPLTNGLPLLQASWQLCRESASPPSRRQKMLFKSSLNPEAQILCYRNKQIYFSLAKIYWL